MRGSWWRETVDREKNSGVDARLLGYIGKIAYTILGFSSKPNHMHAFPVVEPDHLAVLLLVRVASLRLNLEAGLSSHA